MLTLLGPSQRFCDGVSRRNFLRIGALGIGATSLSLADIFRAEVPCVERRPADRIATQGRHQHFSRRRPAPPGHVGPEARRPVRNPRRVQADRDGRPRPADRRDVPADRGAHEPVRRHPLDRRRQRRSRRHPVHERLEEGVAAYDGRPPEPGCCRRPVAGAGRSFGAAVRRPGRPDGAHAVGRPRHRGLPRVAVRPVQTRRPGPRRPEVKQHDI